MNQMGGSRTDTLVKLVLIFFISLLSFSVGTFVGKQFSDSQHKLSALESDIGHRDTASVAPDATEVKPEDALTDEDIANLTEEFVKSEKEKAAAPKANTDKKGTATTAAKKDLSKEQTANKKEASPEAARQIVGNDKTERSIKVINGKKGHSREVASAEAKSIADKEAAENAENLKKIEKVQEAADRIASGQTPTKSATPSHQKKLAKTLPNTVASSTIGKYTVQVASYATEAEATKHAETLREKGFNAYTLPAQVKGKTWYRVSVGLYSTKDDAVTARQDLMKQSDLKAAIIQKIQE